MPKHVNATKLAVSQRAQQSKLRLERQRARGSKVFRNGSNVHRGASQSQSGQQGKRR